MESRVYLLGAPNDVKTDDNILKINSLKSLEITEEDVFIAFGYTSPLAVRLEYTDIPFENLVIATEEKNITKLLAEEKNNFTNDYNPFTGKKIKTKDIQIKKDIIINLKLFSQVMYDMIEAGYMVQENRKKIKDWIVSFEEPILKLFHNYHKFETSNDSYSFEEEFMINPQFRQMLTMVMMKIIANFIINNNLITVDQVSKLGNWTEEKTWISLKDKIKLFQ